MKKQDNEIKGTEMYLDECKKCCGCIGIENWLIFDDEK